MSSQMRYAKKIIQLDNGNSWRDLKNVLIDDWESLAVCDIGSYENAASFIISDFNFNIPPDAKIHSIELRHDFHKDSGEDSIDMEAPKFKILGLGEEFELDSSMHPMVTPIERSTVFAIEDLTANDLKNPDFGFEVTFPKNTSDTEGELFFDFIRVTVDYEESQFVLGSLGGTDYPTKMKPLVKSVGEEFLYTLLLRNVNGVSTEKQVVNINVPEGLEVVEYYYSNDDGSDLDSEAIYDDDKFDIESLTWYPGIRGAGICRIRLLVKCLSEGKKELSAYSKNTGTEGFFYVDVKPEGTEHKANRYEETLLKWDSQLVDDEEYNLLNEDIVIEAENVTMEFEKAQEKVDNLKEYLIKWLKRDLKPKSNFKALSDVSFKIHKGERVGIIGFNGAGKSTLLKVLSGVIRPTKGSIHVEGKIAPLLELGAGFDHNYNGRENIFLNGAILGYSREFLQGKYDEIVEFSELEDFIELPIKNYSSGMVAKLGFAVATIVEPEILILDEILSVGDVRFQKKSGDKLKSMMGTGTTVLLVSHSVNTIRSMCNRVIWLDNGKLVMDGLASEVCAAYIDAAKKASDDELSGLDLG